MQLFVLMLVVGLMVHDTGSLHESLTPLHAHALTAAMVWRFLWPKLLTLVIYALFCQLTRRQIVTHRSARALRRMDKINWALRLVVLMHYHDDLFRQGLLETLRATIGDLIAVDEFLVMLPPILMMIIGWWLYYPIEKKLRERIATDRALIGLPTQPVWTRWQYLLERFRMQIAMMLLPLMLMITWSELVARFFKARPDAISELPVDAKSTFTLLGAAAILLFSPWLLRLIWNTVPLPRGQVRDDLLKLCAVHRVGVRELLEWKTYGGMVNAAVMGMFKPLRYILLSDGLLESLRPAEISAVMAHEVAHVKKHHMFWLLISSLATLGVAEVFWNNLLEMLVFLLEHKGKLPYWLATESHQDMVGAVLGIVSWAIIFGWISRRYERQADTFAVQHLAREQANVTPQNDQQTVVPQEAASVMIEALEQVAVLNCVDTKKRSWRHGSIYWRQQYLQSLVGHAVRKPSIDRVVRRVNITLLLVMVLLIVLSLLGWL